MYPASGRTHTKLLLAKGVRRNIRHPHGFDYCIQPDFHRRGELNDKHTLTGGYGGSRYYTKGVTYDKGMIVEGGVTVLKL